MSELKINLSALKANNDSKKSQTEGEVFDVNAYSDEVNKDKIAKSGEELFLPQKTATPLVDTKKCSEIKKKLSLKDFNIKAKEADEDTISCEEIQIKTKNEKIGILELQGKCEEKINVVDKIIEEAHETIGVDIKQETIVKEEKIDIKDADTAGFIVTENVGDIFVNYSCEETQNIKEVLVKVPVEKEVKKEKVKKEKKIIEKNRTPRFNFLKKEKKVIENNEKVEEEKIGEENVVKNSDNKKKSSKVIVTFAIFSLLGVGVFGVIFGFDGTKNLKSNVLEGTLPSNNGEIIVEEIIPKTDENITTIIEDIEVVKKVKIHNFLLEKYKKKVN